MAASITFSKFQLIVGDKSLEASCLNSFVANCPNKIDYNDKNYAIMSEVLDGIAIIIYAKYGAPLPYSGEVYNRDAGVIEANPRKPEQVEPNKQIFAVYNASSYTLYMSDSRQKGFFENLFKTTFGEECHVKNVYVDPDKFLETLRSVKRVSVVSRRNLLNESKGIFAAPADILGLGHPSMVDIKCDYGYAKPTEKFKEFLRGFKSKKSQLQYSDMVCVGLDDQRVEQIYNVDSVQSKVSLDIEKDEYGMFCFDEIRAKCLGVLR